MPNKNMRSLPWQRLYKNGGVERQITKSSKAMSQLPVSGLIKIYDVKELVQEEEKGRNVNE